MYSIGSRLSVEILLESAVSLLYTLQRKQHDITLSYYRLIRGLWLFLPDMKRSFPSRNLVV